MDSEGRNNGYMSELPATVQVDARGRVQIPLSIRKALGIKPGDSVIILVKKVPSDMVAGKSEDTLEKPSD